MDINTSQSYASQLYSQKSYGPQTNTDDDQKTVSTTNTSVVAGSAPPTTNVVTGTTKSQLTEEMTRQLIDEAQQSRGPSASANSDSPNEIRKRYLHDIATNPEFAAKQAKILGTGQDGLIIPNDVFEKYKASGRVPGHGYELNDPNNPVLKVQKQRTAFYENEVAQGIPPAQIFMDLLKFNLNLPSSYTDGVLDHTNSYPPGYYKSMQQSDLDILSAAISDANSSQVMG